MIEQPLRTTVIGSYPFPGWLEFAAMNLSQFGSEDRKELQEDATVAAVRDQVAAGLDVITDGEQSRLDFNLSFYGYLQGISVEPEAPRPLGTSPRTINVASMKLSGTGRTAGPGSGRRISTASSRSEKYRSVGDNS